MIKSGGQMIALSYSRISDFRQCPHKFKLKYIIKAPNFVMDQKDKSPHLIRGENVHKQLEKYIIKKRAGEVDIPKSSLNEVEQTKPLIDNLMKIYDLYPELQLAIDVNFQQVDWFSREAWFRVIYDMFGFGSNLFIGDFKTGKLNDYSGTMDELGQLHMSSVIGMAVWPDFDEVDTRYIYVDHKFTHPLKLKRSECFEHMKDKLIEEHEAINAEQEFRAKMNRYCGWCDANTDQCSYSKKMEIPHRNSRKVQQSM
jgi:hypothetical protein